jgi:hypothetical protein
MDNKTIIFSTGAALVGAALGFVAGYTVSKKRSDAIEHELVEAAAAMDKYSQTSEPEPEEKPAAKQIVVKAAKLATPNEPGINYTAYTKMYVEEKKKAEVESPTEEDVEEEETEDDIPMETYEERLEREAEELNDQVNLYIKRKGDKIDVLGNQPIDPEYPEVHYPVEDLYYFTEDDCVTDDSGNVIYEDEVIGNKLRRFGWMLNEQEEVYVRNNPNETDYHIYKIKDYHDQYFNQ